MQKLIRNLFTVFILVMTAQICYGLLFYSGPPELKSVMAGKNFNNKIVYLGDSTVTSYSVNDIDKRPTSSFLEAITKQDVIPVTHAAFHLTVYKALVKYLVSHNKPKIIIIPINMRSFSPEWDTRPGYQFKKDVFFLNHSSIILSSIYKPLSIYTDFFNDSESEASWLDSDVFDNNILSGKVKDYENDSYKNITPANIKNKIIYNYRYILNSQHRKIAALRDICILAKNNNLKVLFYITPVDIDYIESIYNGTSVIIDKNIGIIKDIITSNGQTVVDLSHAMPSDYFDWKVNNYPNEHMNEKGKKFVATALSKELKIQIDSNNKEIPIRFSGWYNRGHGASCGRGEG